MRGDRSERLTTLSEAEKLALYGLPDFDDFQRIEFFAMTDAERYLALRRGTWIWADDLVRALVTGDPVLKKKYSGILRAAQSLVKRGLLNSGIPEKHLHAGIGNHMAYWLSGQEAPVTTREFTPVAVSRAVERAIFASDCGLNFSGIAPVLGVADQDDADRLKVSARRELRRLVADGGVQADRDRSSRGSGLRYATTKKRKVEKAGPNPGAITRDWNLFFLP